MPDAPDPKRDKLLARKAEWAESGRGLTGARADPARDRLPPGQHLTRDWPVLDLGEQPEIDPAEYRLRVDGTVERRVELSLAGLLALGQTDSVSDMHCVTTWSRYDNHWRGVAARTLIEAVGVLPDTRHVILHSHDGYTTNMRLDQFDQPDVLLVHEWEGRPITRQHGGPVRVLVPRLYLWKSAKWVRRIQFAPGDHKGFWETRGYSNNADPWAEERYS